MNDLGEVILDSFSNHSGWTYERYELLIASHFLPNISIERELERIDAIADEIRAAHPIPTSHQDQAALLVEMLGERMGFRGEGGGDDDDDKRLELMYLPIILETRVAHAQPLAVLYHAVARRLGIRAHILTISTSVQVIRIGPCLSDDFIDDSLMSAEDREAYKKETPEEREAREKQEEEAFAYLEVSTPRVIDREELDQLALAAYGRAYRKQDGLPPFARCVQLLSDYQRAFNAAGQFYNAFIMADAAHTTFSRRFQLRRRGEAALKAGLYQIAIDDLESYLEQMGSPHSDEDSIQRMLAAARAELAASGGAN